MSMFMQNQKKIISAYMNSFNAHSNPVSRAVIHLMWAIIKLESNDLFKHYLLKRL